MYEDQRTVHGGSCRANKSPLQRSLTESFTVEPYEEAPRKILLKGNLLFETYYLKDPLAKGTLQENLTRRTLQESLTKGAL